MPDRKASAVWEGGLKGGKGTFKGESGGIGGQYTFSSSASGSMAGPNEISYMQVASCCAFPE